MEYHLACWISFGGYIWFSNIDDLANIVYDSEITEKSLNICSTTSEELVYNWPNDIAT
jgi:hypothetical protein